MTTITHDTTVGSDVPKKKEPQIDPAVQYDSIADLPLDTEDGRREFASQFHSRPIHYFNLLFWHRFGLAEGRMDLYNNRENRYSFLYQYFKTMNTYLPKPLSAANVEWVARLYMNLAHGLRDADLQYDQDWAVATSGDIPIVSQVREFTQFQKARSLTDWHNLKTSILTDINRKLGTKELCYKYKVSPRTISELKNKGYEADTEVLEFQQNVARLLKQGLNYNQIALELGENRNRVAQFARKHVNAPTVKVKTFEEIVSEDVNNPDFVGKPVFTWPQNRKMLISQISPYLPNGVRNWIEPWAWNGAVMIPHEREIAGQIEMNASEPQIGNLWQVLMESPQELIDAINTHALSHGRNHYDAVKKTLYNDPVQQAARFVYLIRTSYNNRWRVNLQGHFNIGMGHGEAKLSLLEQRNIMALSKRLKERVVVPTDTLDHLEPGLNDCVFCDPPRENFGMERHKKLAINAHKWFEAGARVIITADHNPAILKLYSQKVFNGYNLLKNNVSDMLIVSHNTAS